VEYWIQNQYRGIKVAKGRFTEVTVLTNVAPKLPGGGNPGEKK
jgi:hypothetical protein